MAMQRMLKPMKILHNSQSYKLALKNSAPWDFKLLKKDVKPDFVWLLWSSLICQYLFIALLRVFIYFTTPEIKAYR